MWELTFRVPASDIDEQEFTSEALIRKDGPDNFLVTEYAERSSSQGTEFYTFVGDQDEAVEFVESLDSFVSAKDLGDDPDLDPLCLTNAFARISDKMRDNLNDFADRHGLDRDSTFNQFYGWYIEN